MINVINLRVLVLFLCTATTLVVATLTISEQGQSLSMYATYQGDAQTLRGVVDATSPALLTDSFSVLLNDILVALGPTESDAPVKIFKTGINTGSFMFHQISTRSWIYVETSETDADLISWHKTRLDQLQNASISSRSSAKYGPPYRLLSAYSQRDIRFHVVVEDLFQGDDTQLSTLGATAHATALLNAFIPGYGLVIRHLYNHESTASSILAEYANNLYGSAVLLTVGDATSHQIIVAKLGGISCSSITSALSSSVVPFLCA